MKNPTPPDEPLGPRPSAATPATSAVHQRRLREIWRSAGWPCQDLVEIELLAAGMLERVPQPTGHETLRVTDAGVQLLAQTLQRNRARRDAHEALVERLAREMTRAGRIVWRGLSLRAKVATPQGEAWAMAMPDVFSIRHTTVESYLDPIVHEVKVHRSDLLSDLRNEAKRAAYLQMAGECWYAIREGIAAPDEIPAECGVLIATNDRLEVVRAAPRRAMRLGFDAWMALARATPELGWRAEEAQGRLGDTGELHRPAAPDDAHAPEGLRPPEPD